METVWLVLSIISFVINIGIYMLFLLHMFQLNSYKIKVQSKWYLTNNKKLIARSIGIAVVLVWLLLSPVSGMIASVLMNGILAYLFRSRSAKKPLVYTDRIKRLIATNAVLLVLSILLLLLIKEQTILSFIILPLFYILLPWIILLANFINRPIEKAISNWYVNDAKKMIQSMPNLTVIGITGSYGKTSVKFFLSKLLTAEYNVLHTPESYNTPMGVVKTIRQELRAFHEIFVCEMGAKNIGDIKEICDIVHPKHGIITAIGPQHLESFKSVENVLKTKFELADAIPQDGMVFLNYDNELIRTKTNCVNIISYGLDAEYNITYLAYDLIVSSKGTTFKMKDDTGKEYVFTTKIIGKHNVENVAGAIAAANKLGVSMEKLVFQVKQLEPVEHRLKLIKRNDLTIIDDAYNSNPSGAKAALDTLAMFEGMKIVMTPGMIELGSKQYECNKIFGTQLAAVCDYVLLVGEAQTKPIYDGLVETGYQKDRIFVVSTLQEGFGHVYNIKAGGKEKVLLLENDLPDNY